MVNKVLIVFVFSSLALITETNYIVFRKFYNIQIFKILDLNYTLTNYNPLSSYSLSIVACNMLCSSALNASLAGTCKFYCMHSFNRNR